MSDTRHPRHFQLTALGLAFALALPAAALTVAGLSGGAARDPEPPAPAVSVSVLTVSLSPSYRLERVFTGRVEADRTSDLGFERAGLLEAVLVAEGDSVGAGQVLARLDTALLQASRRELAAALAAAEADLDLARATLARFEASVKQGAVTRQALDEASEGARAAAAAVELARARLAAVDLELAKSELRAPFDGVLIRRLADEGRVLGAGSPVLTLQADAVPEIRVGVAGPLADALTPGALYELAHEGGPFPARLRALLPVRSAGSRTLDALFIPIDTPAGLRPGDLVELHLAEPVPDPGVWLPVSALSEGVRGLWQVYAVEALAEPPPGGLVADHRLRPTPVEVLHQAGDRVYVQGPIADGERLVRTGVHRVVPGQLVRVLPPHHEQVALEVH